MIINKHTTTKGIEDSFLQSFPYLKLKFYKKAHEHFHGSPKGEEIEEETKIIDLNPQIPEGIVTWSKDLSVDDLESLFEDQYGLHVQVFRKAGDQWLQTSVTDHWTLEKQNNKALESEKFATK